MEERELLESLVDVLSEIMSRYEDSDGIMRAIDRSGFDISHAMIEAKTLLDCLP